MKLNKRKSRLVLYPVIGMVIGILLFPLSTWILVGNLVFWEFYSSPVGMTYLVVFCVVIGGACGVLTETLQREGEV